MSPSLPHPSAAASGASSPGTSPERALVIGGAGRMGAWLAGYLRQRGLTVEIADPAGVPAGFQHYADWRETALDHDLIAVAAPLRTSAAILEEIRERKPPGIVFDVGSLKSPLRAGLTRLAEAGIATTSIHPMFGPSVEELTGRHIIVIDVGHPDATARVARLFDGTGARLVPMALDQHDRMVAYVLGLSHALNIAFVTALADCGESAAELIRLSSTTFDRQLAVASPVVDENPHLYFEIQRLNDFGLDALDALQDAVQRVRTAVQDGDEATFVQLMERGREYLQERKPADRSD